MTVTAEMPAPKVKRVFEFRIDMGRFDVDAALILCIDPRWWNPIGENSASAIMKFAKAKGWSFVPLTEAGGIQLLASGGSKVAVRKEAMLQRIEQELGLHHPKVLGLSVHRDCGGYGYAEAFGNDPVKENARLYEDLWKAKNILEEKFGARARIELYVFDEHGVEEVSF
jgi:hypothetical protein